MSKPMKQPKNPDFVVGERVILCNDKTHNRPMPGVIEAIAKGWYNVKLDQGNATISARAGSLSRPVVTAAEAGLAAQTAIMGVKPVLSPAAKPGRPASEPEPDYDDDESSNGSEVEQALDEAEVHASKMAEALRKARAHYTKAHRPNGKATAHNGDRIAKQLLELEPMDVAKLAEVICGLERDSLVTKYRSLNPGQIRMNSGNRIRALYKRIEATRANSTDNEEILKAMGQLDRLNLCIDYPSSVLAAYEDPLADMSAELDKISAAIEGQ